MFLNAERKMECLKETSQENMYTPYRKRPQFPAEATVLTTAPPCCLFLIMKRKFCNHEHY